MGTTEEEAAVELAEIFAALATELHDAPTLDATVTAVLQFVTESMDCDDAGLVLVGARSRARVADVTSERVGKLYQHQLDAGCGPLMHVLTRGDGVLVDDTAADGRWPEWAALAVAEGVGAVLNLPMVTGQRVCGVLTLVADTPKTFDGYDEALARVLVQHVAIAVDYTRNEQTLREALESRRVVGAALGILMERFRLTDVQAFSVLRRYSQSYNVKLRTIAEQLVADRELPEAPRGTLDLPR